jgi:endonuclease/exonuclease/phosphatase family metal-dependent hydrolase
MFQMKRVLGSHSLTSLAHLPQVILGDTNDHNHRLTQILLEAGFRDTANGQKRGNHTFPSFAPRPMRPLLRLDKVFYNEKLQATDHRVIVDQRTRVASDHLPLIVRLQIK